MQATVCDPDKLSGYMLSFHLHCQVPPTQAPASESSSKERRDPRATTMWTFIYAEADRHCC